MPLPLGTLLCLAYLFGLLLTLMVPVTGVLISGAMAALVIAGLPAARVGYRSRPSLWAMVGVAVFASVWLHWRTPQPSVQDVSRWLGTQQSAPARVVGRVEGLPKPSGSGRLQVWLAVETVKGSGQPATPVDGRLYLTTDPITAPAILPNQILTAQGRLYRPSSARNPGSFDFRRWLLGQECFAGFSAEQVQVAGNPSFGWWMLRQRIVEAQRHWLGDRPGALVSAIAIGNGAVSLPGIVQAAFTRLGLSHITAASGFQISLLLAVTLSVTRQASPRLQLTLGSGLLLLFLGLAGPQPSVVRSVVMGLGGLLALVHRQRLQAKPVLLATAVVLLVWQPLWIFDLGFQFSFLATLGLMISARPIQDRLAWLPPKLAEALAVPAAALLWTLPLQLWHFGAVSPYSLPLNLITTPLVSLISLGGMLSAAIALVWPWLGGMVAWPLLLPTQLLLGLVEGAARLPAASWSVGALTLWQLMVVYGLLLALAFSAQLWPHRRRLAGLLLVILVLPGLWQFCWRQELVLLSAGRWPLLLILDRGQTALVNAGEAKTVRFALLPYLQRQSVNHIDWGLPLTEAPAEGWQDLVQQVPLQQLILPMGRPPVPLPASVQQLQMQVGQDLSWRDLRLRWLSEAPELWQLDWEDQCWLWWSDPRPQNWSAADIPLPQRACWLWFAASELPLDWLAQVNLKGAIASAPSVTPAVVEAFQARGVSLYWTGEHGALRWRPRQGIQTTVALPE
jgi:competence protein ComEC